MQEAASCLQETLRQASSLNRHNAGTAIKCWNLLQFAHGHDLPTVCMSTAVHLCSGWLTSSLSGPRYQRPAPPKYVEKYLSHPISDDTAHLYAMLEYIDYQVRSLEWVHAACCGINPTATCPEGCLMGPVGYCSAVFVILETTEQYRGTRRWLVPLHQDTSRFRRSCRSTATAGEGLMPALGLG